MKKNALLFEKKIAEYLKDVDVYVRGSSCGGGACGGGGCGGGSCGGDYGKMDKKVDRLKELKKIEREIKVPMPAQYYFFLGILFADAGGLEEAIDAYDNAVRADPRHIDAYASRAIVLKELGRVKEGIGSIKKALDIVPNRADYQTILRELEDLQT